MDTPTQDTTVPPTYVDVAVSVVPTQQDTFTYVFPAGVSPVVGQMVWVPFGQQVVQGIVFSVTHTSEVEGVKPIIDLVRPEPVLSPVQVQLARWIARRYLCSFYDAAALMLPPGIERKLVTVLTPQRSPSQRIVESLPPRQRRVYDRVVRLKRLELPAGSKSVQNREAAAVVEQLLRKGLIAKTVQLTRANAAPKIERVVTLSANADVVAAELARTSRPRSKLAIVVDELRAAPDRRLPLVRLRKSTPIDRRALDRLLQTGLFQLAEPEDNGRGQELALSASDDAIDDALREEKESIRSSPRSRALAFLLEHRGTAAASVLVKAARITADVVTALEAEGLVQITSRQIRRDPLAHRHYPPAPEVELTPAQEVVWQQVHKAIMRAGSVPTRTEDVRRFLLHGVTGSGKTEIYLRAAEETLRQGEQAAILVPEISLTPQTIARFVSRFGQRVAVLHSKLSAGERFDEWHRLSQGEPSVVVGSRSALFAPLWNLGLIVIDEEHEWTFKQHEQAPRYDTRQVALKMAELTGATLILGSATPDLVSYHRAVTGEYRLLELQERVQSHEAGQIETIAALPPVTVVDLREELKAGNRTIFSRLLHDALETVLAAGEQAILFLNRRGAATFVLCRDCGYVARCRRCDVALAYHPAEDDLVCHQCNYRAPVIDVCPSCWSSRIRYFGVGTQKVEEETAKMFPDARLLRWDRDVTGAKQAHENILAQFLAREADVLIGTQMIAKGLHLPNVTLVGVISADVGLHLPDYRSAERTFQILTQVAGRAGRGRLAGRVIVQTYAPEHFAIQAASHHDYADFYHQEIRFRREHDFPPFAELARLVYAHPNAGQAQREAEKLSLHLRREIARLGWADVSVIGPAPSFVRRLRGRYRWQVVLRGHALDSLLAGMRLARGWVVDVDPVSLL